MRVVVPPRSACCCIGMVSALLFVLDMPSSSISLFSEGVDARAEVLVGVLAIDEGLTSFSELSWVVYWTGSTKSARSSGYWNNLFLERNRRAWPRGASRMRSDIVVNKLSGRCNR